MKTLAIVSSNSNGSKFYTELVKYFTAQGKKTDQEHIPTILIKLPKDNLEMFKIKCFMAIQCGADHIVFMDDTEPEYESFLQDLKHEYKIDYVLVNQDIMNCIQNIFQKQVSEGSIQKELNRFDFYNLNEKEIARKLIQIRLNSSNPYSFNDRKFSEILNQQILDYISKQNQKDLIIGVIGGAGPLASAQYYELLDNNEIYYIGLDDTLAPGKNTSIMQYFNRAEDHTVHFLPHYKNDVKLLKNLGVTHLSIPCNTAHAYIEDFNPNSNLQLIDIRDSIINKIKKQKDNNRDDSSNHVTKVAVFATPATIKKKLYDAKLNSIGIDVIIPDENIVNQIYNIINRVKEDSDLNVIRDDFLKLVKNFRANNSYDFWILLSCTELSVLVDPGMCVKERFISSTHTLANLAKKEINTNKPTMNSVNYSEDLSNFSNLNDHRVEFKGSGGLVRNGGYSAINRSGRRMSTPVVYKMISPSESKSYSPMEKSTSGSFANEKKTFVQKIIEETDPVKQLIIQ